jgi:hypothetical protein
MRRPVLCAAQPSQPVDPVSRRQRCDYAALEDQITIAADMIGMLETAEFQGQRIDVNGPKG